MKIGRRNFLTSTGAVALAPARAAMAQTSQPGLPQPVLTKSRYVRVGQRNVHYLRAGAGPAVVLLHGTPGEASQFGADIAELSQKYTVYAFDTPGYGRSDPMPESQRDVSYLADSTADAMRALNLPPAVVLGTHTGAAIAIELTGRHPDLVCGLLLDGVGVFNQEEMDTWFDGFITPLVPDRNGSHFTFVWTRCRDQMVWFPWSNKDPQRTMGRGYGAPERIHGISLTFMQCGRTYADSFKSALFYAPRIPSAFAKISQPAVIMCGAEDVLSAHLDRLPALKTNPIVHRAANRAELNTLRDQSLARLASPKHAPGDLNRIPTEPGLSYHVADMPHGPVFMRIAGDPSKSALIILHDAPGSSLMISPLISALSAHARVYAIDLPGSGESAPLSREVPSITEIADTVGGVGKVLGLKRAAIYGIGFSSSVALEVATRFPNVFGRLVLQSALLPLPDERTDMFENYAPPIEIKGDGSHWYATWLMLRDSLSFWPWYRNTMKDRPRRVDLRSSFDADHLHNWTFEVMKQHASYHHVIKAALRHDARAALQKLGGRILLCKDHSHPFAKYDETLIASRTDMPSCEVMADPAAHARQIARFLS